MLPSIDIGPFVLPTAGLVYLLGGWLALSGVEWAAKRLGQPVEATYSVAAVGLLAGVVGARLAFVALHWPAYGQNPLSIIWPINTGFDPWGGLLIGAGAAWLEGRRRRLPALPTLDALAPGLLLGLSAVSLVDFLSGPGYGTVTAVPWGLVQFGVRRHPVQLYEIAAALLALASWRHAARSALPPGAAWLAAVAMASAGRLFSEAFRANAWITEGGWRGLQFVSLAILLIALYSFMRLTTPD